MTTPNEPPPVYREADPAPGRPVRDRYGRRWAPEIRQGDGFQGWVHRPPGDLAPHWMTWGQLTTQLGPVSEDNPVAVLLGRIDQALERLGGHPDYDTRRDWLRWTRLEALAVHLVDQEHGWLNLPATDEPARLLARVLLGEDVTP